MSVRLFIFFGIFFTLASVHAQEAINQTDAEGKRHGIWKKTYPSSQQLRYQGQFEHGKEVGVFKFYCEECKDQPTVIKEFNRDNPIAKVSYYTIKGKLVSEGQMNGKARIGEWVYYHEKSDQVMERQHYVDGKLDGVSTVYYPNGTITETVTYAKGERHGENLFYAPDGVLLKKLLYKDGQLHGPAVYYDAFGNVTIKGQYKNGKKDGLWQYYKNGKVEVEETYPKPNPSRQ